MLVNCNERKNPPTNSKIIITAIGVVVVKPAQMARKAALITELTTRMFRKAEAAQNKCNRPFHSHGAKRRCESDHA